MSLKTVVLFGLCLALLVMLMRLWNRVAGGYNDRILAQAPCKNCQKPLGAACILPARQKWREELIAIRMEGRSAVKLSNLELQCPHCGTSNFEQDIYQGRRRS